MSEGSTFDNHCDQHQVMEVILRQPACKVDAATEAEGYTALHMAASKGSLQVPPPYFPRSFSEAPLAKLEGNMGFACVGMDD